MRRIVAVVALLAWPSLHAPRAQQVKSPGDPWQPLRFLIGSWEANTTGGSAGATVTGRYSFALELHDHLLARHSADASCQAPVDYNCEHSDLLYIYRDASQHALRAIYFDNEGHVINYEITTPEPNTAVFLSPSVPGPRFRLTYRLENGVMQGAFDIRMPGALDFQTYLKWSGARR